MKHVISVFSLMMILNQSALSAPKLEKVIKLTPVERDLEKVTWRRFESRIRKVLSKTDLKVELASQESLEVLEFRHKEIDGDELILF